jgi:hypothetical protein
MSPCKEQLRHGETTWDILVDIYLGRDRLEVILLGGKIRGLQVLQDLRILIVEIHVLENRATILSVDEHYRSARRQMRL